MVFRVDFSRFAGASVGKALIVDVHKPLIFKES